MNILVIVLSMSLLMGGAYCEYDEFEWQAICYKCECLNSEPFDVDCETMELTEYPEELGLVKFNRSWILSFEANLFTRIVRLPPLQNLIRIKFSRNQITEIEDEAFIDLPDLQEVDLSNNKLTKKSLKKDTFKGPQSSSSSCNTFNPLMLVHLDLSYNDIHSLEHNTFRHLCNLKSLSLGTNPISDISIDLGQAINEIESLEYLDLSRTGIHRIPDHLLTDFLNLTTLVLAHNELQSIPDDIKYTRKLKSLNLNSNPIKKLDKEDFGGRLSSLQELSLSEMPDLEYVDEYTFSGLKNMEILRMHNCPQMNKIHRNAFSGIADEELKLREVYLQNNALETLDSDLLPWLDLEVINIQRNPWICDCHFKWVYVYLLPHIEMTTPHLTISIVCAAPPWTQGMNLQEIGVYTNAFQCYSQSHYEARHGATVVLLIFIGCILFFTGTIVFSYVLYKRSRDLRTSGHTVKYLRTYNEEEELFNRSAI